jgi:hypothetical protein
MVDISAVVQAISEVSNPAVRAAAQAALDLVQSTGSQSLANNVASILGKSAAGNGTAIFYSGDNDNNLNLAQQCRDKLTPTNSYTFSDTQDELVTGVRVDFWSARDNLLG